MQHHRFALRLAVLVAIVGSFIATADQATAADKQSDPILTVVNERGEKFEFSLDDLKKMPRKTVKAAEKSGEMRTFEGVAVADVLQKAKVTLGADLRGPLLANYALVEARDKYRVVFALPEFDPAYTDDTVIIADTQDGKEMAAAYAPLRFVLPQEKHHSRWIRQMARISILKSRGSEAAPAPAAK